jgi:hypothetical protein
MDNWILNNNIDELNSVNTINELEYTMYKRLKKGLENITGSSFPMCVLNLKYVSSGINPDKLGECICGKTHLKYENYFTFEDDNTYVPEIIIGTKCISTIKDIQGIPQYLKDYINEIIEKVQDWKKHTYKIMNNVQCLRCQEFEINPNYNYKNHYHTIFCRKCVIDKTKIKCLDCPKFLKIEPSRGDIPYKLRCKRCWYFKFIKN